MNQELSTTPSINETLLRLVIALVISGPVVWVMAVAGSNAEATSNNFFIGENGSTSVITVEPGLMAAEAKTAFSQSQYRYVRFKDWNTRFGGEYVWVDNGCQATFRVRRR